MGVASLLSLVTQLLAIGFALWATPKFVRGLGDADYGLLAIIGSFTAYFAYLELGIGAAYVRSLASAIALGETERAQRLVGTAHSIYVRVATVGAVGMLVVGVPYLGYIVGSPTERRKVWAGLVVTAITFGVTMSLSASRAIVISAQRSDLYAMLSLVVQPLIPIGQLLAIRAGGGLVAMLAIMGGATIAVDTSLYFIARHLHPELPVRRRYDPAVWKELRSFSLWRFLAQLTQQGQLNGDRLLVGTMLPASSVAPYAVAVSLAQRARLLGTVLSNPFFAAATERWTREREAGLADATTSFGRRIAVLLALGCASATFLGGPFLTAWIGPVYGVEGQPVLRAATLASSLLILSGLVGQATDAAGHPRVSAVGGALGLAVSVSLSIVAVRLLGAVGAAYGFLLGATLQLAWGYLALGRLVGARLLSRLLALTLVAPALVGAVATGVMFVVPHRAGLVGALPSAAAGLVVGVIAAIALGVLRRDDVPARLRRLLGLT